MLRFPSDLTDFNRDLFQPVGRFCGDQIPVSKFTPGGEVPTGTSQLSKRGIAENVPHWHAEKCVQCNQCSFVCPHAVIRTYQIDETTETAAMPQGMETLKSRKPGHRFRIGVSALDCTGCAVCAETCPVKCLEMVPLEAEYAQTHDIIRYCRENVSPKPQLGDRRSVVGMGMQPPYFEFPGSCAGCGETPLVRLVSQMFGEKMVIAAATGCNTIWGGSFPLCPYTRDSRGEGPAWHNSLFEDAAELGLGQVTAYKQRRQMLIDRVNAILDPAQQITGLTPELRAALTDWLRDKNDSDKSRELRDKIIPMLEAVVATADARLVELKQQQWIDLLAKTSFWIFGGDGWAYDIGFSGLDHVLAQLEDVNILVLDTEVYSNTGGQRSKATPLAAQAKFAVDGKDNPKKDLCRIAMTYEHAYVASIAQGADMSHAIKVLQEAEAHPGPSLVVAYTPCTEHHLIRGMRDCMKVQKLAVETGYWILFRYNPALAAEGKNPFQLDCKPPSKPPKDFLSTQGRFVALEHEFPERAKVLQAELAQWLKQRFVRYQRMVQLYEPIVESGTAPSPATTAAAPSPTAGRVLVLYATNTGNSQAAADSAAEALKREGITVKECTMDEVDPTALAAEPLVAIFCSSGAEGIPANGAKMFQWLSAPSRAAEKPLARVRFALFGLGDSAYEEYLRIPKRVDSAVRACGATPFMAMGDGDESKGGFRKNLAEWLPKMVSAAKQALGTKPISAPAPQPQPQPQPAKPKEAQQPAPAPAPAPVSVAVPAPMPTPFSEARAIEARDRARANKAKLVEVAQDVYWVGAVDFNIRDFHGIETLRGSSYNCFLILGPAPTLIDTVKAHFAGTLISNIRALIDPSLIKYVVVNHAEPDHSSALGDVLAVCPNAEVVCTAKCKDALQRNYRGIVPFSSPVGASWHLAMADTNHATASSDVNAALWHYHPVASGNKMRLGPGQTLWFLETPMVHWPESTFTYLVEERVLFSMDAFGQHVGSIARFDDELLSGMATVGCRPTLDDLIEHTRSYYANILMPFGKIIAKTLDKFLEQSAAVEKELNVVQQQGKSLPRVLATAHGVMWRSHTDLVVSLYRYWTASRCLPKVLVLYGTMYGATEKMARAIAQGIIEYRSDEGKSAKCVLLSAQDVHATSSADEALDAACIAVGSPTLNNFYLPIMGPHLAYLRGLRPEGRSGFAFGSFGWGATGTAALAKWLDETSITQAVPPLSVQFTPDAQALQKCYEAGRTLARIACEKGVTL